ncbi:protein Z, vitamin K-dependent plasma glycoprotein b isoform X1 [Platichthys flesus]|uniref:protein Z, vitamin K-dependent plasma glycoprotein b isoform X1 n=1 Tax=Platichthys flesus TaxID=8260 RepID=UPI002DB91788|nr:protein Z, vitamin K-dependent plasma glycoprotein b isoform X1 [Platichthys flesus]
MADTSIMSVCCRASVLALCFLVCFLQVLIQGQVFLRAPQAHHVLLRTRRANWLRVEEVLPGNLERECYEERCSFEEARECFEDTEKTNSFWTLYYGESSGSTLQEDGDQCEPNPCLHSGNCTDLVGGFQCSCPAPFSGTHCDQWDAERLPATALQVYAPGAECPTGGPTACHQTCTLTHHAPSFTCSCTKGFKLQTDRRSCVPEGAFPCGRLPGNATTSTSCHGNCPWQSSSCGAFVFRLQVTVLNSRGAELCGGAVLGRRSILTAARCLVLDSGSEPRASDLRVLAGNRLLPLRDLKIHNLFRLDHHDNDLALLELARPLRFGPSLLHLCLPTKDFSENILMHSGRTGVAGNQELVYLTLDECRAAASGQRPISNKMFCMRRRSVQEAEPHEIGPLMDRRQERPVRKENGRQNPYSHGGHQGAPVGATFKNSSSLNSDDPTPSGSDAGSRSEVGGGGRRSSGPFPGSPVATVDRGTAFLTGLMISTPAASDSLVFTKLSRYLTWIKPSLEAAENRMTPQVHHYPESR